MKADISNHQFIFICGLHRSGTSVLHECLREHPLISGFKDTGVHEDEGQHLQSVYPPAKFYGGPGKFAFNQEAHLTEDSSLINDENRIRLFSDWKRYWDTGKPFLVEKSPPNLIRTRFLQKMFPDSYFIIILRHPVAVAYATQRIMGGGATIYSVMKHWVIAHKILFRDRDYINKSVIIKYEDFVENPYIILEKLYAWLKLKRHDCAERVRPNINQRYFERWEQCDDTIFRKYYRKHIMRRLEKEVNAFGYSLCNLDHSIPWSSGFALEG